MSTEYENLYDSYPNGFGEDPGSDVPVEVVHDVTGLGVRPSDPNDSRSVREIVADGIADKVTLEQALTQGPAGDTIDTAHENGHSVGFQWGVNHLRVIVAKHPHLIAAAGVGITVFSAAAAAGVLYLVEHHKSEKHGEK